MSAVSGHSGSYDHEVDDSVVIELNKNDLRVTWLGTSQLVDKGGASESALEPLRKRLDQASGVLEGRARLRRDEAELAGANGSEANQRHNYGQARDEDSVAVRFAKPLLPQAIAALEAFLERENPALERFGHREGQLIDPPDKVKKTLRKFQLALETVERRAKIADAEAQLLS